MNPQVYFIASMLSAEINDIFISISGNEKVQKVIPHSQLSAEVDDPFIEVIHLEKR